VRGGKLNVPHTLDIAYVFDNIAARSSMTGEGPDKQALADKMSGAWTNFARTGSPNGAGLPDWPAYNGQTREVMVLNDQSRIVSDPRREERLAIAGLRSA
jgi:para-nitrobenzyl esterase